LGTFQFDFPDNDSFNITQFTLRSFFASPVLTSSDTRLVLGSPTTDFRLTMVGSGFSVTQLDGQITEITGGTLSSFTAQGHGSFGGYGAAFTDLNLSLATLAKYVSAENWTAVNQYMFSKADKIVSTGGLNNLSTFAGNDTVFGYNGDDTLFGGSGDDKLYGLEGHDDLFGGADNDSLFGGVGSVFSPEWVNKLFGGAGDDDLTGGSGIDRLVGGAGRDVFVFKTALRSAQHDTITDFRAVDDVIRLDNIVFTAFTTLGTMLATRFHVGVAAADAGDRIIYDRAEGVLSYDRDGTGSAAAVIFAVVDPGTALGYQDIVII
jgi:Ca2+-binding RTX toxin-like protein